MLALTLCASVFSQTKFVKDLKPTVILISLDGFRYDYLDKFKPKVLNELAGNGVRAKWMIPSFPTKTFPNHYTIATGLYPAHHGIVENNVFDFDTVFTMSKREEVANARWWFGEPIWVTAEKQGQIAASYFFVGTETKIGGLRPKFWRTYNGKVPPEMRVDKVLGWLDLPQKERPTMITLYFSDTDDAGHEFSPDAEETKYAVWNADRYVERLMNGLKARNIDQKVNVIIVSDHGMAPVDLRRATFLDDYFDIELTERILWTNEIVQIFPKPGKEDQIYSKIRNLEHSTCWKKAEIPERLHYRDSTRIAPIVCSSEEGWLTTSHKRYDDWMKDVPDITQPRGAHGYDNKYQSMQATFIAHGEAFKKGKIVEPFANIEVYNLMCNILNLAPAPNDGNQELSLKVLKDPTSAIRQAVK
jgi:predicted AlkP superfamily pyrophosphatase or phosphodiesterase